MLKKRLTFALLFLLLAGGGFVGGVCWQSHREQMAQPHPAEKAVASQPGKATAAEAFEKKERKKRMLAFPTVIQKLSNPDRVIASPYKEALMLVKCRGTAEDYSQDFIAAFTCKEAGNRTLAACMREGLRVRLERVPMDEAPAGVKEMATADDILDFTLPVYWVKSFTSAETLVDLTMHPGRMQFTKRLPGGVMKGTIDVPAGAVRRPMYFYGADWQIYAQGAEDRLIWEGPGGVRNGVRSLSQKLKERGTTLVFVPVPQSASLYPDVAMGTFEGARYKGPRTNGAVGVLLEALRRDGVAVVDLYDHFSRHRTFSHDGKDYTAWLTNDTHWTSWAAAETAAIVAKQIRQLEGIPAAMAAPDQMPVDWNEVTMEGDIAGLEVIKSLGVEIAPVPTVALQVAAASKEAETVLARDNLAAPVQVMGDSYTKVWEQGQAGFSTHLARELGLPVWTVSSKEGGERGAPTAWVHASKGALPKVLVWLVAERGVVAQVWAGGELLDSP